MFGTLKTFVNIGKNICNDYSVPVIKSLEKNKDFEIRLYEKTKFIVYKYRKIDSKKDNNTKEEDDPVMKNVWRLMKYTQGENEKNLNMKLYMPVFVHIENLNSISSDEIEIEVKIMVALPPEFQINKEEPPKPTDPDLYFEIFEEFTCYVRSFSGFADENVFKIETDNLKKILAKLSFKINASKCICISYDPPYKLVGRKNEVIVIAI